MNRINPCNLPEELAQTRFVKTFDAVGTPEMLKTGICRAEYDMGPSLSNFLAFMDSTQHDLLKLSIRNRKITQLLYIGEKGELPQNYNPPDWVGTTLCRMADPLIRQQYSPDQLKNIGCQLTEKLYPDTRIAQNGFTFQTQQERYNYYESLSKTPMNDAVITPRAVPSQPRQGRKSTPTL